MILKDIDDKTASLNALEEALKVASGLTRKMIERELRNHKAGVRAEKEAAYHIDFYLRDSKESIVLHDLRFVVDGQVAQIDHLILHRSMTVFVVETKSFHSGLKITDHGEFLRWNDFAKKFEGMPSPIEQNARHVHVLQNIFARLPLPKKMGAWVVPEVKSVICVNPSARIDRSKKFPVNSVVKADQILTHIEEKLAEEGILVLAARRVELEVLTGLAAAILKGHRPRDYVKDAISRIPLSDTEAKRPETEPLPSIKLERHSLPIDDRPAGRSAAFPLTQINTRAKLAHEAEMLEVGCRHCGNQRGSILNGRFGYYFKCEADDQNTPIKGVCSSGHKLKVSKSGEEFTVSCARCSFSRRLGYNNCHVVGAVS